MPNSRLPEWLEKRYGILWNAFKDRDFTREELIKVLREKSGDDERTAGVIISELNKGGWLKIKLDPNDARKRLYRLEDMFSLDRFIKTTSKLTRDDVKNLLKRAADLIRTRVDYKFILILLFLKRISDKWELEYEKAYKEALEDGLSEEEAKEEAKSSVYHDFDLPEEFLWDNIRKDVNRLPEKLSQALKAIGERNPELKDVVDRADFIQFTTNTENSEILRQLVELFSSRKLHHVSADILGDAYEWILGYFAPQKAKEGEVYTPREVIKLLVEILDPKPKESVYDPACGSGGMLIIAHKHVEEKFGKEEARKLFLFGEEANQTTYALCKMNVFIHDIRDVDVRNGDTLIYPKFREGETLKQFDVVVANPPWNQDGYPEEVLKKGEFWRQRFKYGFPPKQSADWAWIQHMLASAKDDKGRVGVVIDNGCLFRGGKEKTIRSKILEDDLIECVILLPEKLFYNTGAPGAIIILNKNKPPERKNKILFINASQEYEKHPDVRKLNRLGKENIKNIVEAYQGKLTDGFARLIPLDEIRNNDYNLNVTLYVFPQEEIEEIDVKKEWSDLKTIENEIKSVENKIEGFLKVVGING
ncbi:MAG: SAM-dependent DNA methyltransferase [Candidatus Aenigmarchaeota archaeon]|nr:SAM-dependent DNA methyltransferase [Candidatus Aenigmarchaeota archaeon]